MYSTIKYYNTVHNNISSYRDNMHISTYYHIPTRYSHYELTGHVIYSFRRAASLGVDYGGDILLLTFFFLIHYNVYICYCCCYMRGTER